MLEVFRAPLLLAEPSAVNWLVATGTALFGWVFLILVVCAHPQTHPLLAIKTMNLNPSIKMMDVVSVISRETKISARDLLLEFPIYDVASRSLKQMVMLRPIANVIRGASHVGGSIATGASGTVVVRAIDHMSFEIGQRRSCRLGGT